MKLEQQTHTKVVVLVAGVALIILGAVLVVSWHDRWMGDSHCGIAYGGLYRAVPCRAWLGRVGYQKGEITGKETEGERGSSERGVIEAKPSEEKLMKRKE